jgi:hypothetical protein
MRKINFQKLAFVILGFLVLTISATSCKKDVNPDPGTGTDNGIHKVDPRLVGSWLWTQGSSGAYYDNNGVYVGPAYGLASKYIINADGSGTCYNHMYSTIGAGTGIEVNISYVGFFETDDEGHMGFFPTSGTYKSTSGENRALRADELWNTQTNKGRSFLYQKLVFTTQGGRQCFQVTSSEGIVDTYFKVP